MTKRITKQGILSRRFMNQKEFVQLCWKCERATGKHGGCSWQKNFVPVEGWIAEKTMPNLSRKLVPTYKIIACPLFIQDTDELCTRYLYQEGDE